MKSKIATVRILTRNHSLNFGVLLTIERLQNFNLLYKVAQKAKNLLENTFQEQ